MSVGKWYNDGITYCNAIYDSYLCWPPTEAGNTAYQNCPPARLSDTTRLAFRQCGTNGLWLGRRKNESSAKGWTNYTPCFPAEVQHLFVKVYDEKVDPQSMFQIAQNTRYLEMVGFSASLVTLLISLFIFIYFRTLHNSRTRIHRNLFLAMILQVVVRLVLYLDQAFLREGSGNDPKTGGLDGMPYVCEACYILLEYGISAMFCWMFIEGLFLHGIVTADALRERISYAHHLWIGWGAPVIITAIWTVATAMHYRNNNVQQCWYGYNFLPQYWICQGPRLNIALTNLVFLLNILRVLIGKLNRGQDSELEKVRKAVRAALVLLPLLGITNIFNMVDYPIDSSEWKFAMWSYSTHFLRSFQGYFIALIYCFLNGEVRQLFLRLYGDWQANRNDERRRRELTTASSNRRRRRRRSTGSEDNFRALEWVQGTTDNQLQSEIEIDGESETEFGYNRRGQRLQMYDDPEYLDNLSTLRIDSRNNSSNIV